MRFDPNTVKRYITSLIEPGVFVTPQGRGSYISSSDYDNLHTLLKEEIQGRKDDAREHAREIRDAVAETRWHERESAENGY